VEIIRQTDKWNCVEEEIRSLPTAVDRPILALPIYQDGLQCQFCRQIYRSRDSLRVHWSKKHRFSAYGHGSKPRPSEIAAGKAETRGGVKAVVCQRVSPRGLRSHYIHILYEPEAPPPLATQAAEAVDQLREVFSRKIQLEREIQHGTIDETNP
jgi:hypothetical protein